MYFLFLSLLFTLTGPILLNIAGRWPSFYALFEKLIQLSMAGVIVFHILPDTFKKLSWPLWPLILLGWGLPYIFETRRFNSYFFNEYFALGLGLLGLLTHNFLDGVILSLLALSANFSENADLMRLLICLHRIPESLFICMLIQPRFGLSKAINLLSFLAVVSISGYAFTEFWFDRNLSSASTILYGAQALGCGALIHLMTHTHKACKTQEIICVKSSCHK